MPVELIGKSDKLKHVCYEIRGPVLTEAMRLEQAGNTLIKLNIGNLAAFNFFPPQEIIADVQSKIAQSSGYADSKGIYSARKAVMQYTQSKKIKGVEIDDVFLGNGASELIVMAMQGLLNQGDEVLVPAPDYPLWTASISLAGGKPIHYLCDEENQWLPALDDIRRKITSVTRALIIINPNNPTGALYPADLLSELVAIAREHDLIIFADEIYDKMLFDNEQHTSIAALSEDVLTITINGLSKNYRCCGFRAGWLVISGDKRRAGEYIDGLNTLASMRLCANVPAQHAIQTALGGYQSLDELIQPGGLLYQQRERAYNMLTEIPGVSCFKAKAALYLFPRLDPKIYKIQDDKQFALDLLQQKHVLIVQGSGFNWPNPDHFRLVFLPSVIDLETAMTRIAQFLATLRIKA